MSRVAIAAVALCLLAGSAACGDDDEAAAPSPESEPELRATATRSSLFDSQRTWRLELRNDGPEPVTVATIQLDSPLFAPLPASERDTQLAPGQQLLLPLPYWDPVCDGPGGASVVVAAVAGDEVPVPLEQRPDGLLEAVHARECDEAAVREAVDIALGPMTPSGPTSVSTTIDLRPRGDSSVTLAAVEGNIVMGVRVAPAALPATARPGRPAAVPVELVVDRCDIHALIESKRTFSFPLAVALDGGEPVPVVLEAAGDDRAVVQGLIEACIG